MRIAPLLLLAALVGCETDSNGHSKAGDVVTAAVDAAISPMEIKRVPPELREDGDLGDPPPPPDPAKMPKMSCITVATRHAGSPVFVDQMPVGRSRDDGKGGGSLEVKAKVGWHEVVVDGESTMIEAK